MHLLVASWFHGRMKWDMMISWHCLRLSALKCPLCMAHSTKSPTPYSVRLEREHSTSSYGLMYACIKPGFHYPSWRPELTGDRFPLPVNTDGGAFPLAEYANDNRLWQSVGPSTRLMETRARQHGPCWRVMETGHPSTRAFNSGRQLG